MLAGIILSAIALGHTCATYSGTVTGYLPDGPVLTEGTFPHAPTDNGTNTYFAVQGFESQTNFDVQDQNILSITYYPARCGLAIEYNADPIFRDVDS